MTPEQKSALDLAVLNLKTHGDDQLLSAVQPLIDFYEARRTVSGQEAEAYYDGRSKEPCLMWAFEGYKPGPHDVVLIAAPIPATVSGQEAVGYVIPERLESTDPVISLYRKPEGAARKPVYAAPIPATEQESK